ncbi:hypothetical protein [Nocardiopsis ganjiahuensis]|uniref:hypothetical protein n=1 Tax=Nocardiopsis ganjiahuensis TaxID=239984 RepID=UPI0003467E54|nr:hypothetical protein [Nocardiopsis ganjiahuensis]
MESGIVFAALLAGHWVADHWAQSDHQATRKGECGWEGRRACAAHTGGVVLCQLLALVLVAVAGHHEGALGALQLAAGLGVNALTHYWADRRHTLEGLARVLGKHGYYSRGGAPHLDQAWHMGWLLPSALIITAPSAVGALLLAAAALVVLALFDQFARIGRWEMNRTRRPQVVLYHR